MSHCVLCAIYKLLPFPPYLLGLSTHIFILSMIQRMSIICFLVLNENLLNLLFYLSSFLMITHNIITSSPYPKSIYIPYKAEDGYEMKSIDARKLQNVFF